MHRALSNEINFTAAGSRWSLFYLTLVGNKWIKSQWKGKYNVQGEADMVGYPLGFLLTGYSLTSSIAWNAFRSGVSTLKLLHCSQECSFSNESEIP